MSDEIKKIVMDGRIDTVKNIYQMTMVGLDDPELLREFAIRMTAISGKVLAEVMGRPAVKEYSGGFATKEPTTGDGVPVESVTYQQVEEAMREAIAEVDNCPCPTCVSRRRMEAEQRLKTPDPNVRH